MISSGKSFAILLLVVAIKHSNGETFESQFLGNFVSEDVYKDREICSTKVCMMDNDLLIYSATHEPQVNPCEDFREFAMGEFIKYRKLHDRYQFLGFDNSVDRLHRERQRKLLSQRIGTDDPKYLKVLKNFFSKCVNSSR